MRSDVCVEVMHFDVSSIVLGYRPNARQQKSRSLVDCGARTRVALFRSGTVAAQQLVRVRERDVDIGGVPERVLGGKGVQYVTFAQPTDSRVATWRPPRGSDEKWLQ